MKKKILVFNGYYIPSKNYGGPTTSLSTIVSHCSEDFSFYIIAADHDLNSSEKFSCIHEGWNNVGNAKVLYVNLWNYAYKVKYVIKIIKEINPDLVWLVGILVPASKWNVAYICRKFNIPYLISPRGEVCENTFHLKYLKKKIVSIIANILNVYKNAYYHATSIEERDGLIKYFNASKEKIFIVPNIPLNLYSIKRNILKEIGKIKIVFISRIQEKKNLLFAIKSVLQMNCEVQFDIYGPIESTQYWEACMTEIKKAPNNILIKYLGLISPREVLSTFKNYHCFLFPTLSENYGHVIVEAMSVSCPVILSKGTTPWDDIDTQAGYVCDLNNIKSFTKAMTLIADMNNEEYQKLIQNTSKYYDKKMTSDNSIISHINMFKSILN